MRVACGLCSVVVALAGDIDMPVLDACLSDSVHELQLLQTQAKQISAQNVTEETSGNKPGNSKCPCIGFSGAKGTTSVTVDAKTTVPYPADLGASCEAWDDGRNPKFCKAGQAPGKGKGWCAQQWCYVDPCKCDLEVAPKTSAYLPKATYQGKTMYYSYATCGGKDTFVATNHKAACVNQKDAAACGKLPKCMWNKKDKKCGGKEVMSKCSNKATKPENGAAKCKCVGIKGKEGSYTVDLGGGKTAPYPAEIGGSCQAWDLTRHPSCRGKGKAAPKWCNDKWCYVDPCSCGLEVPPKTSAYLPSAKFQGHPIYYSYATCGAKDKWTKANHKAACVNQKTSAACAKLDKCLWVASKKTCLGKALATECGATVPTSAATATSPYKRDPKYPYKYDPGLDGNYTRDAQEKPTAKTR